MRRIVVGAFISLDGVMQAPGGPEEDISGGFELGGWTVPHFDEGVGAVLEETLSAPFDLLLGRKTYDIFAAHWPRVAEDPAAAGVDDEEAALARTFNAVTKYVATHRGDTLSWQNSEALGDDIAGRLKDLKQSDGPILLVQGSSELIQTLLVNDLVDELRLLIFPIVLGEGKRMFGNGTVPAAFRMTRPAATSPSGVVAVSYERTGAIETGSFALED